MGPDTKIDTVGEDQQYLAPPTNLNLLKGSGNYNHRIL
jgi:hypothetical protein